MAAKEEKLTDEYTQKFNRELLGVKKDIVLIEPYKQVFFEGYVEEYMQRIENMTIYEDDVWIATFPKSGSTWTGELVWCLRNNLGYENQTLELHKRIPFLELCSWYKEEMIDTIEMAEKMPRPRIIKTHLGFDFLPKELQRGKGKMLQNYVGDLDTMVELFTRDLGVPHGPFFRHILSYWERRSDLPNLFITSYEEMQMDLASVVKKVANFIGVEINEDDIFKLCDHLSFNKMKNNAMVNYQDIVDEKKTKFGKSHNGTFINKGKTGNWKEKLSDEMIQKFKEWEQKWLADSDLKFIYEL